MRKYGVFPVFLVALHTVQAKGEPIRERKVDSFVEVELTERSVKQRTFRTIGSSFDFFKICSYAALIVFGITSIRELIPLSVFLKVSSVK